MTRVNLKTITKALFSELSKNLHNLRKSERDDHFNFWSVPIGESRVNIYVSRFDDEIKTKLETENGEEIDFDELLLDEDKNYLQYLAEKEIDRQTENIGRISNPPKPSEKDSAIQKLFEDSKRALGHD